MRIAISWTRGQISLHLHESLCDVELAIKSHLGVNKLHNLAQAAELIKLVFEHLESHL